MPANVWTYTLGGYRVLKKWLSYREASLLGRPLHPEESDYFAQVVRRITAILLLGPALFEEFAPKSYGMKILQRVVPRNVLIATDLAPGNGEGGGGVPIAKLIIELDIPHAHSLKDRRQVVRSLKDKLRHAFNAGVAELDEALVYNRATLGIVAISSSSPYLRGQLEEIDRAVSRLVIDLGAQVLDSYAEILDE